MLGYWPLTNNLRNYGSVGYGKTLQESGDYLWAGKFQTSSGVYYSFEATGVSGKILEQSPVLVGLMNLKNGQLPYIKFGNEFFKPDNNFAATEKTAWSFYYRPETFGDKDYTLSIYKNGQPIYTNGISAYNINPNLFLCPTSLRSAGLSELKISDKLLFSPLDPNSPLRLFGTSSGSVGSGISLFLGSPQYSIGSGMNLTMGAYSGSYCYLLDESGNILYDELDQPLIPESSCPGSLGGFFLGCDLYISGQSFVDFQMPLYLQQGDLTYGLNSGIPLVLQGGGISFGSSIDLTAYNNYGSIESGMHLYIEASGLNDGYVPIGSGFPLYIGQGYYAENTTNLFISGASPTVSGSINLYLNANTYPVSGAMNLAMPYVKGFSDSGMFLYEAGY